MRPDYARAEREAAVLLKRCGIDEPPIDPVSIAGEVGVKVVFVRFNGDSDQNVSGYFDFESNQIIVNRHEYPLRQTFTIAHELGHKILHEPWTRTEDYRVLLRDPANTDWNPIEQEANAFAANLLMPRFLMDSWYKLPVEQISRIFAVSVPAVKTRLSYLYGI